MGPLRKATLHYSYLLPSKSGVFRLRSSKEESASCEEMALRNGILNKNALIAPLKQSIIKAITLPPQDHVSGRVMAYPCEGREGGTMPRGGSS